MQKTIDGIQVLRAIAAIMVVFYHARFSIPSGAERLPSFSASGVDIFFIISGFVMSYTTPFSAKHVADAWLFIRRRIARIVPLYWIILIWTARRGPFSLGLLKDFFFVPRLNDTYVNSIEPIVIQGWTLNSDLLT
jgi:exopolysaccharide production protein ExoZ